jgi:hypothetical protein
MKVAAHTTTRVHHLRSMAIRLASLGLSVVRLSVFGCFELLFGCCRSVVQKFPYARLTSKS